MYREAAPRDRCRLAHEAARREFAALTAARERVLVARGAGPDAAPSSDVPAYEPVPDVPADAADEDYDRATRRYEDLAAYFATEALRLGALAASFTPQGESVARPRPLGPPPRAVPASYAVAETLRGLWLVLRWLVVPPLNFIAASLLTALHLIYRPLVFVPLAALAVYAVLRARARLHLLARGEAADVVARTVERADRSRFWPLLVARGWDVTLEWRGDGYCYTTLTYRTSRGGMATARLLGAEYQGVLLCDPDAPAAALPLTAFGCAPRPDAAGAWDPRLSARTWLWMVAAAVIYAAWIVVAVVIVRA